MFISDSGLASDCRVQCAAAALDVPALLQHGHGPVGVHVRPADALHVPDALHGCDPVPPLDRDGPVHDEAVPPARGVGRCGVLALQPVSFFASKTSMCGDGCTWMMSRASSASFSLLLYAAWSSKIWPLSLSAWMRRLISRRTSASIGLLRANAPCSCAERGSCWPCSRLSTTLPGTASLTMARALATLMLFRLTLHP